MKTTVKMCQCAAESTTNTCTNPNCTCVDCQCGANCTCGTCK
ncbi:hypothetical protein [Flavobacterium sp. N1994]|nr:hypothetical protein [Flavobacterium sp. N1994]